MTDDERAHLVDDLQHVTVALAFIDASPWPISQRLRDERQETCVHLLAALGVDKHEHERNDHAGR
jgi:hypothetical protein